MSELMTLTKRHIKTFLRDKVSVFFSFLSIIILLAIYLLFLGKVFSAIPGIDAAQQGRFTIGYIMGGVLVVGTLTLSLGVLGVYVTDLESKKINGFLVTPVSRQKLTLSYYIATVVVTLVLTIIMFLLASLYLGLNSGVWFNLMLVLQAIAVLTLFCFISVSLNMVIMTFVKSSNAFGTVSSLVGTLIGFISGIYIPLTMLDDFTQTIASILPFSHMTMYLKKLLIGNDILSKIPAKDIEGMGIVNLKLFGLEINDYLLFAIFTVISIGILTISFYRMNKKAR